MISSRRGKDICDVTFTKKKRCMKVLIAFPFEVALKTNLSELRVTSLVILMNDFRPVLSCHCLTLVFCLLFLLSIINYETIRQSLNGLTTI